MGVSAGRDDVCECEVQIPERRKCALKLAGQLLKRDLAITIEPALSDR